MECKNTKNTLANTEQGMQYEHKPGFLTLSLFLYPSYNLDNASWQALDPQAMQPKAKDQQQSQLWKMEVLQKIVVEGVLAALETRSCQVPFPYSDGDIAGLQAVLQEV
jgi:hypothetical protein